MTQTTIRNFFKFKGERGNIVKIDDVAQMVVVLTTKEMSYLVVGLFDDLVGLLLFYICDCKIFACAVCPNSTMV